MKNKIQLLILLALLFFSLIMLSCNSPRQKIFGDLPSEISPNNHYLFYLHGKIIEEKGIRPTSPQYGIYEYKKILTSLSECSFIVISEARGKNTDVYRYAEKVVEQIKILLKKNVPPYHITVVGASKGGIIAMLTSALLKNKSVNFVFMASCFDDFYKMFHSEGMSFHGNILSIYEKSDSLAGTCQKYIDISQKDSITRYREIQLHLGTGHGILYQPLKEWIDPVTEWAKTPPEKSDF